MPETEFNRRQAEAILARAAELEAEVPTPADSLTLSQLLNVAEQSGIDPALVKRAALELKGADESRQAFHLLGGPTRIARATTVEVAGDVNLDEVAAVLGQAFDDIGRVDIAPSRVRWTSTDQSKRKIQAMISRRGDEVSIQITESLEQLASGLYNGLGWGLGVGAGAGFAWLFANMFGPLGAVLWIMTTVLVSLVVARTIFARLSRERVDSVDEATRLIEHALQPYSRRAEPSSETVLDLDSAESAEVSAEVPAEAAEQTAY